MHGVLLDFLRQHRKSSGFVLRGDRGNQLNYNHVLKAFTKHIITTLDAEFPTPDGEMGFKDGRLHSFRHFFVSECFAAGIPEGDIRMWVGHSDSKILALYRHIRNDVSKSNIRRADFGAV